MRPVVLSNEFTKSNTVQGQLIGNFSRSPSTLLRGVTGTKIGVNRIGTQVGTESKPGLRLGSSVMNKMGTALLGRVNTLMDNHNHQAEIRNVKKMVMEESEDFMRKMTHEHQGIAKQFIEFKKKTYEKMDTMDDYHTQMQWAELALALKFPIYEAEYQIDKEDNPLKLYDCFVPRLKQHLVSKPAYKEKHAEMQQKL